MRLWHYKLIDVLPTQYILGQWREVLAISGTIKLNGKLNHATVNRANDYSIEHLIVYADLVIKSFSKREFTIGTNALQKLKDDIGYSEDVKYNIDNDTGIITLENGEILFENFHNDRYLTQNVIMFQEKYDVDMISKEDWLKMLELNNNFNELYKVGE